MAYEVATCSERKRDAKRAQLSLIQTGMGDSSKSRPEVTTSLRNLLGALIKVKQGLHLTIVMKAIFKHAGKPQMSTTIGRQPNLKDEISSRFCSTRVLPTNRSVLCRRPVHPFMPVLSVLNRRRGTSSLWALDKSQLAVSGDAVLRPKLLDDTSHRELLC